MDLSALPQAHIGTEVTLWGQGPHGSLLSIDEVAWHAGTIGYELMCAISPRVPVQVVGADSGGHGTAHGTPPASAH